MSSHIQIQRICQLCGAEFTARTTVTRYCSHRCSSRAHKQRVKQAKIQQSNTETVLIKTKGIEDIRVKEFPTISGVAVLIGCARRVDFYFYRTNV